MENCICKQPELAENVDENPESVDWDEETSGLIKHAKDELTLAGYDLNQKEEDPNKWIAESVLELIRVFAKQGHSGSSAPYCVNMFSKLAKYETITPLTGNDDEWVEVVLNNLWQNKRNGAVFKDKTGYAWFLDGKIFEDKDGCSYTSGRSKIKVVFPCIPKSKYIKYNLLRGIKYYIQDIPWRLSQVFKKKNKTLSTECTCGCCNDSDVPSGEVNEESKM